MEFLLVKKWLILVLLQKFLIPVLATSDIRSRKSPLRTIIRACLQGSMRRAYKQKVLLCFQTLFTYGSGKGEASSVFCVLHPI